MDVKIECRNMELESDVQDELTRVTTRLHDHHHKLMHIRVVLDRSVHHRHGVRACDVLVVAGLPRRRTFVARKASNEPCDAIRAAFEALDAEIATFRSKRTHRRTVVAVHESSAESQEVA